MAKEPTPTTSHTGGPADMGGPNIHLNNDEREILIDALNMALQSNKRMQVSKPKFAAIFQAIENDINALKAKL